MISVSFFSEESVLSDEIRIAIYISEYQSNEITKIERSAFFGGTPGIVLMKLPDDTSFYILRQIGSRVEQRRSTVSFCREDWKTARVEATVCGMVSIVSGSRNHRMQPNSCRIACPNAATTTQNQCLALHISIQQSMGHTNKTLIRNFLNKFRLVKSACYIASCKKVADTDKYYMH